MTDTLDALERLARLHQSGALTDAEFAEQKARVLRGDGASRPAQQDYHDDEPAAGEGKARLLFAALGAVLLGVLLWWQLVDSDGELKPVPTPGTAAASVKSEAKPATAAASPTLAPATAEAPLTIQTGTAPAPETFNPSFTCAGQDEPTLVMICESPALSRKDRELSGLFKDLLRSLGEADRDAVLRQQRAFLRERRSCADVTCIGEWYDRTLTYYRDG